MIYFKLSLKRFLRNKANILIMVILPSLLIGAIFSFSDWGNNTVAVGLADKDNTRFTRMLVTYIQSSSSLVSVKEDRIKSTLSGGQVHYIFVIENGFTEAVLKNKEAALYGYSIQESNMSLPVKMKVEQFMAAARQIASLAKNEEEFYSKLQDYQKAGLTLQSRIAGLDNQNVSAALGGIGLLAMSMMFLSISATMSLLKDKENRTFYRVMTSPLTLADYMLQNIASFLLVSVTQVTLMFMIIHLLFNISLGASIINLYVIMILFSLLCVSLGVALAGISRNTRQAGTASSLLIVPMSMLGGFFWPSEMMPVFLQKIGQLLPTSWVMSAARKVILGSTLAEVRLEMFILILFALVFFLLGSWRKTEISR